jgi:hypothetical protein
MDAGKENEMPKVVIIGAGYAGCGAAATAARAGAEVDLFEQSDVILGVGFGGGSCKINGQFTLHHEALAMGGTDILGVLDEETTHREVNLIGEGIANLFHIIRAEENIRRKLKELKVSLKTCTRVKDVKMSGHKMVAVVLNDGTEVKGDVFIDTTGSAGPMGICNKYGNGCSMCNLKCPTYGGRLSVAAKAGVEEWQGKNPAGKIGAMGVTASYYMDTLSEDIKKGLLKEGVLKIDLPKSVVDPSKGAKHAVQLPALGDKMIIMNCGYANILTGVAPIPIALLRTVPGFEYVINVNPAASGNGHNVRYVAITPCETTLKVKGVDNLFVAGDKAARLMGITEAVASGNLAGYNAACMAAGKDSIELPKDTVLGALIAFACSRQGTEEGLVTNHCVNAGPFLEKMKADGTYVRDAKKVEDKIKKDGKWAGLFSKRVI